MNDIRQLIPSSPQFPQAGKSKDARLSRKTRSFDEYLPPKERGFQQLPAHDALMSLIDQAREAMRQGVFWDRGSIVNITV